MYWNKLQTRLNGGDKHYKLRVENKWNYFKENTILATKEGYEEVKLS